LVLGSRLCEYCAPQSSYQRPRASFDSLGPLIVSDTAAVIDEPSIMSEKRRMTFQLKSARLPEFTEGFWLAVLKHVPIEARKAGLKGAVGSIISPSALKQAT